MRRVVVVALADSDRAVGRRVSRGISAGELLALRRGTRNYLSAKRLQNWLVTEGLATEIAPGLLQATPLAHAIAADLRFLS
jgi:hypothetical protein